MARVVRVRLVPVPLARFGKFKRTTFPVRVNEPWALTKVMAGSRRLETTMPVAGAGPLFVTDTV